MFVLTFNNHKIYNFIYNLSGLKRKVTSRGKLHIKLNTPRNTGWFKKYTKKRETGGKNGRTHP
jgi:hypothetical protein